MTIQQAIEKAIEGGYENKELLIGGPKFVAEHYSHGVSQLFLDPIFWQSLGKAMGWKGRCKCYEGHTHRALYIPGRKEPTCFCECHIDISKSINVQWKKEWHRFIDHLAEG